MRIKLWGFVFFLILLFDFAGITLAAQPDSGSILRQQEQLNSRGGSRGNSAEIKFVPELKSNSKIKVIVKKFKFTGYKQLVPLTELEKFSSPYIGRKVTLGELQHLTREITKYLREKKGYLLARAYLPQQDVTTGIVTIAIIPGRLDGNVHVLIKGEHRISKPFLKKIADNAMPGDGTIKRGNIERAVLLMNDLPGVSAQAYLDKGSVPGTTRVSLLSREGGRIAATISADNFGNRYTGAFRRTGQVAFIDNFHRGDLLQLTCINADHMNQGRVEFSLPVGARGTLADFSYNGLAYRLGGGLSSLHAKGTAQTLRAGVQYPLKRTQNDSIWIGSDLDYYTLEDRLSGTVTSDRDITMGNVNFTADFYDNVLSGGLNTFSLTVYTGNLGISDGKASDEAGARTDGNFTRATYSFARLQRETKELSLFFSMRGQFADSNLDSSQKFILGGPTGVRAYPIGEAAGDEGLILSVEQRWDMPFTPPSFRTQLVAFADAGDIRLHKNTWPNSVTNISDQNHYWLSGAGLGITMGKSGTYQVQLSYAHKVGKNVGRDTSDNDSDNRHDNGRFWLEATFWI